MTDRDPAVELWVDEHQEYEPGVLHGELRHARVPLDPHAGDFLVVGDDDAPPCLLSCSIEPQTGNSGFGCYRVVPTVTPSIRLGGCRWPAERGGWISGQDDSAPEQAAFAQGSIRPFLTQSSSTIRGAHSSIWCPPTVEMCHPQETPCRCSARRWQGSNQRRTGE